MASENFKGPILSAMITAVATLLGAWLTGHWKTPAETRDFQKTKQENVRLVQENEGLRAEIAGLRQENTGLKQQNASLNEEIAQARSDPADHAQQPQEPPAADGATQKVGDFVSRLDSCQKNNSDVTCVSKT
jgi:cell division protein FtsB